MYDMHRESVHDPESLRFWELDIVDGKIIGCAGPFLDKASLPSPFDTVVFERNTGLMQWLRGRCLRRVPPEPSVDNLR